MLISVTKFPTKPDRGPLEKCRKVQDITYLYAMSAFVPVAITASPDGTLIWWYIVAPGDHRGSMGGEGDRGSVRGP